MCVVLEEGNVFIAENQPHGLLRTSLGFGWIPVKALIVTVHEGKAIQITAGPPL